MNLYAYEHPNEGQTVSCKVDNKWKNSQLISTNNRWHRLSSDRYNGMKWW